MIQYLLDNFNWLLVGMSITAVVVSSSRDTMDPTAPYRNA